MQTHPSYRLPKRGETFDANLTKMVIQMIEELGAEAPFYSVLDQLRENGLAYGIFSVKYPDKYHYHIHFHDAPVLQFDSPITLASQAFNESIFGASDFAFHAVSCILETRSV